MNKKIFQYYYKDINCKAPSPAHEDCICWYDEGTGPHKHVKRNCEAFQWREQEVDNKSLNLILYALLAFLVWLLLQIEIDSHNPCSQFSEHQELCTQDYG